jgi:DNA-binding CsgD family transcriptional regulator
MVGENAEAGGLDRYLGIVGSFVKYGSSAMNGLMSGADSLAKVETAFYRADMKKVKALADTAIKQAVQNQQFEVESHSRDYKAKAAIWEGDADYVIETIKWHEESLGNPLFYTRALVHDYFFGWLYAHLGLPNMVPKWLRSYTPGADHLHEMDVRVRAKYLMAVKRWEEALAVLDAPIADYNNFLFHGINLRLSKAICYNALGDTKNAAEHLRAAYDLSHKHGIPYAAFIERGSDTISLINSVGDLADLPEDWQKAIIKQTGIYIKKKSHVATAVRRAFPVQWEEVSLTFREGEVLKDLSHNMTYPQMAERQGVSINAIKQAQKLLYTKLGVSSGMEAVEIGRERRLI